MNRSLLAPAAVCGLLAITACGSSTSQPAGSPSSTPSTSNPSASARETIEAAGHTPRLAVTYDGGVQVLDATKGTVEADIPLEGFTRLSQAGDGRHLAVSMGEHVKMLDMGSWSKQHGDHYHAHKTSPLLTDITFDGMHPGHIVNHAGKTAIFWDGEGRVTSFDPASLSVEKPKTTDTKLPKAHHGVAIHREDGTLVHTVGDDKTRTGIAIDDAQGKQLASNADCPGVHGDAIAKDGVLMVGCENGVLIVKGNTITKVASPDAYGRIGNQAGSEKSNVVLGDYKVDKKAELERPTRITLTDTATGKLKVVPVGTSYSFRSLGRGPAGEALLLGTDGALRVIDPATGAITRKIPVTKAWTEPMEWQKPRPTLFVQHDQVWVSEPASKQLHLVDITSGKVSRSIQLEKEPNELNGVLG